MKILSVSAVFPPAWRYGGPAVTAHAVAKAMIRQGHHVFAVCTADKSDSSFVLDTKTEWDGVPVIYCSRKASPIPFYSPSLQKEVASCVAAYDVVIIRSSWTYVGPAASRECLKAGIPYLAYPEGNFNPWAWRRRRLRKALFWHFFDKRYFQQAAAIVALTGAEADSIRRIGLTNRIEVIPNGVDVRRFANGITRRQLEEKLPQIRSRRIVLFLGRLHPIKGIAALVTAFKWVRAQHADAILVVAGPDENGYRKKLEHQAYHEGLLEDTLFLGLVVGDLKVGLLRHSEVFVLPSYSEGFPITVLEALASHLPVILTKNCHVPEVAAAGAGIEVDTSPRQIANALSALLSDDSMRVQMGENASRLAAKRFSWNRVAKMTSELCSQIAWGRKSIYEQDLG